MFHINSDVALGHYCVYYLGTPYINATTPMVTAVEGETAQLNCTVRSTPTPTLQDSLWWYRSGSDRLSDDNDKYNFLFENGLLSLIIHNVNSSDDDTYICYVNNTHIPVVANDSVILITMSCKSHDNHMINTYFCVLMHIATIPNSFPKWGICFATVGGVFLITSVIIIIICIVTHVMIKKKKRKSDDLS